MTWNLLGHEWAADILVRQILNGNVKHAYMFCGPDGIGKRSLALRFAQALTCPNATGSGEPCRTCSSCQRIAHMQHPDLFVITVSENRREISIDQMRALQHDLSLAPYEASIRIGLLLDFQNSSDEAQNAILKTLEEPTSRVVLMLTASRPEDLLPTISSRCEIFRLHPAGIEETATVLGKESGITKDLATKIAHLSNGCYGLAHELQQNPEKITKINLLIDGLLQAMAAPLHERFTYAEELTPRKPSTRENLQRVFQVWMSFWRDALVIATKASSPINHKDFTSILQFLAAEIPIKDIHAQLVRLEDGLDQLNKNANMRLLTEVILMGLPQKRLPLNRSE